MSYEATAKRSSEEVDREAIDLCLTCALPDCLPDSGLCPMNRKEELDLSGVSRVAVARAVHCVPEHISQVFLGKTVCSLPLAYDIAHFLGVTLDEFYRAVTGANGKNPARKYRISYRDYSSLLPKYTVDGKGYPNLREALLAIGVERRSPTHYNQLPEDVKKRIVRNRPFRGR